jgi:hypothetical protein
MRDDFSNNWRNMDPSFIKCFLIDWKAFPQKDVIIDLPKENYDEMIVKDLYGRDLFSFEIEKSVFVMISQYEGFWNMIYIESNGKIIIFTG